MPGSHREIFDGIYRGRLWREPETVSGPGSTRARAADFRDALTTLLRNLGTRVLLDAGCGDANWIDDLTPAVQEYVGVDVVPDLVEQNALVHGGPGRTFLTLDITTDPLPRADVILCRDCLVHFSLSDVGAALRNFARSGSTWLLATTFLDTEVNGEVPTGGWRPLNLQRAPFAFPPPASLVDERCPREGAEGKRFGLWPLAALPPF